MRAMYSTTVGELGRRGKLPLPSPCDQTKLIPADTDSASTLLVGSGGVALPTDLSSCFPRPPVVLYCQATKPPHTHTYIYLS
jgi:hypothetical protein